MTTCQGSGPLGKSLTRKAVMSPLPFQPFIPGMTTRPSLPGQPQCTAAEASLNSTPSALAGAQFVGHRICYLPFLSASFLLTLGTPP